MKQLDGEINQPRLIMKEIGDEVTADEGVVVVEAMKMESELKSPIDGKVTDVNQATITGESIPIEKSPGDEVYAGTINEKGSMEVKVTHLSKESTLAKIIHLIEDAHSQKAPFQN